MRISVIRYIEPAALLLCLASAGWAGVAHMAPQAVVANSPGWTNLNNTLANDGLYATCTGGAQFTHRWFRDSLPNTAALGIDTVQNRITSVIIYVKGYSSNKRGKAQLTPYFGATAGTPSAAMPMGTSVVTLSYDITSQRNNNPGWGGWRWQSLDSLNIQAAVRGNGLSFFIDYVYAVVSYASITGSNHYFVMTPSSVFDPETLGVPFQHLLTLHDVNTGQLLDTYNGLVVLSDSTGTLVPNTVQFVNGQAMVNFAIFDTTTNDGTSPQRTVIKISDGDTFMVSNGFRVINGLYRYWFAPVATPQTVAVSFPVSISALNAFDDTVTAYSGTASLTAAAGVTFPSNITFSNGHWSGNVTITGAGEVWNILRAESGVRPAQGQSNAFYLQGDPGPVITYISPANGATGVLVNAPVVIGFSERIDQASFAYACDPNPGNWSVSWNATSDTVRLTHNDFAAATLHTFAVITANDLAGNPLSPGAVSNPFTFTTDSVTVVGGNQSTDASPRAYGLSDIYPNPMRSNANIRFSLPKSSDVRIEIYNIAGERVMTLANRKFGAGYHQVTWRGQNESGHKVAAGVYFVRMSAKGSFTSGEMTPDFNAIRKMTVLR